jgi:DNA repair protein RadC
MNSASAHDRPREKLDRAGVAALGDRELVAVLVGHGTARASVVDIADRLLDTAGGVHGLTRLSCDELARLPGVGAAVACRVLAAVELGRRTLLRVPAERPQFLSPREAAAYLLPQFGAYPVERFGVLLLDGRQRLIRVRLLTMGSVDASVVHPREVFREAAAAGAASIVMFHNHPSGDPSPSAEDIALTRRLVAAGQLMGIEVIDHVILADSRYCSIKEAGRL